MACLMRPFWATMFALCAAVAIGTSAKALGLEQSTPARAAILVDVSSGAVLLEKNPDAALPPASMSKLMLLDVVFEALETGRLALTDEFRTTKRAAAMGGSKMFIREGGLVSVENLVRGVVVHSGNDAAVALAEALAGTEEDFSAFMNRRGRELGLKNSFFANATGWPHPDHRMSVRDLALIAERIVTEFPTMYTYFREEEFTWEGVRQRNRNPLLGLDLGVDGLKTGHTEEAGYGLVASAVRDGRRVVLVVMGLESEAQRKQEAERLINWAFRAFETKTLYRAGEPLVEAEVWIGDSGRVPLAPAEDVVVTLPFGLGHKPAAKAEFRAPIEAPIDQGMELGRVTVTVDGMPEVSVPLVATQPVSRGGFFARIQAALSLVSSQFLPSL